MSTPQEIIVLIRDKLVSDGVFTDNTVFISLNEDIQPINPPSTLFGLVVPGAQRFRQGDIAGGGRDNHAVNWSVRVCVLCNTGLDQGDRDTEFLTNATLGVYNKVIEVIDSLSMYYPTNVDADYVLIEPMRPLTINNGFKLPGDFGGISVDFSVKFVQTLPTVVAGF